MYKRYLQVCDEAINNIESWKKFRNSDDYCSILEHKNYSQFGRMFLDAIHVVATQNEITVPFTEIMKNDTIGSPQMFEYSLGEYSIVCSPTTLRYVLTGLKTLSHMKDIGIKEADIVEIGAGYGGQCRVIYLLAPLFEIKINSYGIFDLDVPMKLQAKYLTELGDVPMEHITFNTPDDHHLNENSFLISNYCISEIEASQRDEYYSKILRPYVSHGYLYWNMADYSSIVMLYQRIKIVPEDPCTNHCNVEISF